MQEDLNIKEKILEIRIASDKKEFIEYFVTIPKKIDELANCVFQLEEYPYKEYASWILMHLVQSKRIDVQHLYPSLVDVLFKTKNQTVLRNVTNCIYHLEITKYRESDFIDLLLGFIKNYENKVAVQVYAIYSLMQFVTKYPELTQEVSEIIEFHSKGKTMSYMVAKRRFEDRNKRELT